MSTPNDDALKCSSDLDSGFCDSATRGKSATHIRRLVAENEAQRELLRQAVEVLTCTGEADDPGHRCGHCDDYVDRNGTLRAAINEHLKEQP